MGILFVCAIFVYSIGATCLGDWGEVPGWVVFMSVDIITGNLWGLYTGEWDLAPKKGRLLLKLGMGVIIIAIIVVAISQAISVETAPGPEDALQKGQDMAQVIGLFEKGECCYEEIIRSKNYCGFIGG